MFAVSTEWVNATLVLEACSVNLFAHRPPLYGLRFVSVVLVGSFGGDLFQGPSVQVPLRRREITAFWYELILLVVHLIGLDTWFDLTAAMWASLDWKCIEKKSQAEARGGGGSRGLGGGGGQAGRASGQGKRASFVIGVPCYNSLL